MLLYIEHLFVIYVFPMLVFIITVTIILFPAAWLIQFILTQLGSWWYPRGRKTKVCQRNSRKRKEKFQKLSIRALDYIEWTFFRAVSNDKRIMCWVWKITYLSFHTWILTLLQGATHISSVLICRHISWVFRPLQCFCWNNGCSPPLEPDPLQFFLFVLFIAQLTNTYNVLLCKPITAEGSGGLTDIRGHAC